MITDIWAGVSFLVVGLAFMIFRRNVRNYRSSLPPGPPGLPFIGNILDLNVPTPWRTFDQWSQTFGDIMTIYVLGKPLIVLNSVEATVDLLEKRSANYSDRPDMPMIKDLMGWTWTFALMRYGPRWRQHRKIFVHHFHIPELYRDIQVQSVHQLLHDLSWSPEDFFYHLRNYTGSIIMKRVYGHTVSSRNDPFVELVDKASESTSLATKPPGFLVDLFPMLKCVPSWFPGAGFKRQAREWRKLSDAMVEVPFDLVKGKCLKGASETCFVSTCLEELENPSRSADSVTEELIKNTAAVAYAAGVDTTASSLTTFIFAMVMYPAVQKHAQIELDAYLSDAKRLPTFEDRESLPFINAIVKETLRWIPVLPLGVPHRSVNGDTYKGFLIPPGTTIIPNTWAILHDAEVYKNPAEFNPARFIENRNLRDPFQTFGYGRRTCAGRDMALDALWLAIANILYSYDIKKCTDLSGIEINPEQPFTPIPMQHNCQAWKNGPNGGSKVKRDTKQLLNE